jgi:hypothetical protein
VSKFNQPHVGIIVEGQGDVASIPLLLRNYLHTRHIYEDILGKPVPLKGKGSATKSGGIEGYAAAATSRPGCKALLLVLDADEEKSCILGPEMAARISQVTRIPILVAVAERDYEDWLYSSAETLQIESLQFRNSKRGLKEIQSAMDVKYRKSVWQSRLTARIDFKLTRARSSSFDRLLKRFDLLVDSLTDQ